jgi:hypothetical protein
MQIACSCCTPTSPPSLSCVTCLLGRLLLLRCTPLGWARCCARVCGGHLPLHTSCKQLRSLLHKSIKAAHACWIMMCMLKCVSDACMLAASSAEPHTHTWQRAGMCADRVRMLEVPKQSSKPSTSRGHRLEKMHHPAAVCRCLQNSCRRGNVVENAPNPCQRANVCGHCMSCTKIYLHVGAPRGPQGSVSGTPTKLALPDGRTSPRAEQGPVAHALAAFKPSTAPHFSELYP